MCRYELSNKVLLCHRAVPVIGNNALSFASAGYYSCCFTRMWLGCFAACYAWCFFQSDWCHESKECLRWAEHYSACVLKRRVPLPRLTPAACFGVNKPRFCSSACSPEGRNPEPQLDVLIKAFREDYTVGLPAFCAGEVVGKRLSRKCRVWTLRSSLAVPALAPVPDSKHKLSPSRSRALIKENIYYARFFQLLMNTDFITFHDFSLLQNSTNIYYRDILIKLATSLLVRTSRDCEANAYLWAGSGNEDTDLPFGYCQD